MTWKAALSVPFLFAFTLPVLAQLVPTPVTGQPGESADYLQEQPVRTKHAMVVSIHHLASDAGVEVLQKGGNAVDAAVATGFALAVVHPAAGNLGGGGFMLIRDHSGKTTFLDYREKAPAKASADMYLDAKGEVIPETSVLGYRASGVPGSVAGMAYAERKYGKLSLRQVMSPAIRLADEGFVLTKEEADTMRNSNTLSRFPESKRIFQRNGRPYQGGEFFRQPELGRTLRRIAADPDEFYHGRMARQIAEAIAKGGGLITEKDLDAYQVKEREPLLGSYHGYTIIGAPPPSSGGVTMIEALNILEGYNLAKLGDRTPDSMHLILEAYRRAYMDRNDYLGDPDFVKVPSEQLLDQKYADAWRISIEADHATPSESLKRPEGFLPPAPQLSAQPAESSETTHYSVVDSQGNAVAVTTTLNGSFGSGVTVGGLGFLMNNEMDDFTVKLGVPNMFGLIQGPANAIAPGKRPLSSMTPTIILKDGKLRMVLGSPGGPRIITTVANIFLSETDGGLNIQQAVDAPRFHHQYLPDKIFLEPGFTPTTVEGLRSLGYDIVQQSGHWSNGECIVIDPQTGDLLGGQDHRSHYGKAAGY
jgi:gamma-glutamyltranspeptidase / glutathione hydrolase